MKEEKGKKKKFILNPPAWFALIIFAVSLIFIVLSIVLAAKEEEPSILACIVFALSACLLGYSVYLAVREIPVLKSKIHSLLEKSPFTYRLIKDWGYRAGIVLIGSFIVNILYAIFEGTLAVLELSLWYGSLAGYHFCLSGVRFYIVRKNRTAQKQSAQKTDNSIFGWSTFRMTGVAILVLSVAISAAATQMVLSDNHFNYAGTMIYGAAAYTFYKFAGSIYRIFRAKRIHDPLVIAMKNVGFADALVSMLGLQSAMIATFSERSMWKLNAVTGIVVCILTVALGIIMIVSGTKKLRKIRSDAQKTEMATADISEEEGERF